MKYNLYIDESGDHGLSNLNADFPIFLLCGIIVSSDNYEQIDVGFKLVKKAIWNSEQVIFHSRDIRKCEKEFKYLFNLDLKKEFYKRLDEIINNSKYQIVATAIEKMNYIKEYGRLSDDVYEISLSFLIEHTIFYLNGLNCDTASLDIIIEKRGVKEDKKLHEHFQKLLSRGTGYITSQNLHQYSPTISFKNKKENVNGLQLADLVAYPTARYILEPNRLNPAFDVFKNKFYKSDAIKYGIKIFP